MVIIEDKIYSKQETVAMLEQRDGTDCAICNEPLDGDTTIDHWIPLSKEGTWDLNNLKLAHRLCNTRKGNRLPNPDGTLPPLKRELKAAQKAVSRANRPEICDTCMSGRILLENETCVVCGSGPQPSAGVPGWANLRPKECPHSGPWQCWQCYLGFVEREPAIVDVLDGSIIE